MSDTARPTIERPICRFDRRPVGRASPDIDRARQDNYRSGAGGFQRRVRRPLSCQVVGRAMPDIDLPVTAGSGSIKAAGLTVAAAWPIAVMSKP